MKCVLYEGKAYEVGDCGEGEHYNYLVSYGAAEASRCTEITEAEYHARKLLDCDESVAAPEITAFLRRCE